MRETAYILQHATSNSLVIMDEVGRGTSTVDGISIALAVIKHLRNVNNSLVIFATHYHELAKLVTTENITNVSFYQALVSNTRDSFSCLYKIAPGVMDDSHGIQIAKLAGLPSSAIEDAKSIQKLQLNSNL